MDVDVVRLAGAGDFLCDGRTVVYKKSARRPGIAGGVTVEFDAKVSRPKGEDYCGLVDADRFEVV